MSIFQVQSKDAVVRIGAYNALNALQNFSWEPRFNEEYVQELGNKAHVAQFITPEVTASFEMTSTGSSVALMKKLLNVVTAGEFAGYKAGAPGATTAVGTIRTLDLENMVADLIEAKKPNEIFSRSTLLPRMFLSSISMRAQSNGTSSETYSFEGDLVRIFPTGKHDLFAVPCSRKAASSTVLTVNDTAFDDIGVVGAGSEAYAVHSVMIDEVVVPSGSFTCVGAATGEITLTGGYTAAAGQRLVAIMYKRTAGAFPTIQYPTAARFIKGHQTDIFLVPTTTVDISQMADGALNTYNFLGTDRLLRAQSMDMNVDMRREALRQIAKNDLGSPIYARSVSYPLNITASLSVLETTMDDHAKLTNKIVGTDVLDLASFENQKWQLVRRDYLNSTPIQTMALMDARVSGRGSRISQGGRAEISWSFTGSDVMWDAT